MAFSEDLDVFLSMDTPGAVSYTVDGGSANIGIFSDEWQEISVGESVYSGIMPTLVCKDTDVTGKMGTTVVIGSSSYTIRDIQTDGTGVSVVIMTEQ